MPPFASSQLTVLSSLKAFQNYLPMNGKAKDREDRKTVEALCLKGAGGSVSGILVQIEESPSILCISTEQAVCGRHAMGGGWCWVP